MKDLLLKITSNFACCTFSNTAIFRSITFICGCSSSSRRCVQICLFRSNSCIFDFKLDDLLLNVSISLSISPGEPIADFAFTKSVMQTF